MLHKFFYVLLFTALNASAQTNAYQFIEPNISFSYDTTQVKITNKYSISVYKPGSVDFTFFKDKGTKSVIHVTASNPLPILPDVRFIDSMMLDGIKEVRKGYSKEVQTVKYDTVVRHINTFSCIGFIMYDKIHNMYEADITCNHLSENDATEVQYTSFADTSLATGYKRLEKFLAGFTSYSSAAIQKEEEEIKKTYKVVIKKTDSLSFEDKIMKNDFRGIVEITPRPTHKIFGAMVMGQLFEAGKENILYITDKEKDEYYTGVIRRTGKLILFNSFGKAVEIPFSFEYTKLKTTEPKRIKGKP